MDTNPPEHPSHPSQARSGALRRFVSAPISILFTLLFIGFYLGDIPEELHHLAEQTPNPTALQGMRAAVQHQLQQMRSVDAFSLAATFGDDLDRHDCNWLFLCTAIPDDLNATPSAAHTSNGIHSITSSALADAAARLAAPPPQRPAALIPVGPFSIPTFHTLRGTPHALLKTITTIVASGLWASVMFATCALLYLGLWRFFTTGDSPTPLITLFMLVVAPVLIPLLVQLLRWIATGLFTGVSWVLTEFALLMAYALAIKMLVELPHVFKAPHEIAEAATIIRNA